MKDMKKVKLYFKKLVYSEMIGLIRGNIGKDVWNNNVHKRCCGMEADDDIDIDNVTAMIIITPMIPPTISKTSVALLLSVPWTLPKPQTCVTRKRL